MSNIKLKYGVRNGKLIHISQVDSGLACSCYCSSCSDVLVAKKGQKREMHFAHKSGNTCLFSAETALHFAAKEILCNHKEIRLPPVWIESNTNRRGYQIAEEKSFLIDSLKIEQGIDGLIPDLTANISGHELFIEIFVTHRIDDIKKKKIEKLGRSTIEIDLSKAQRDMSFESLTDLIVNSVDNKQWIYNARSKFEFDRMLSQTRHMKVTMRGFAHHVDFCPIKTRVWHGKYYANLIDDCIYCEHCLDVSDSYICCNAHVPKKEIYRPRQC